VHAVTPDRRTGLSVVLAMLAVLAWSVPAGAAPRSHRPGRASVHRGRATPRRRWYRAMIRREAPGRYRIDRRAVRRAMAHLGGLVRQVRVGPVFLKGRQVGYRLHGIRRASVFALLGLRNGDLVRSVNGTPLDSLASAFKLYRQFMGNIPPTVTLRLTRGGVPLVRRYHLGRRARQRHMR